VIVVLRRVWRIGVLTLERDGDRWYVRCRNRTYEHRVEIARDKIDRWRRLIETGR